MRDFLTPCLSFRHISHFTKFNLRFFVRVGRGGVCSASLKVLWLTGADIFRNRIVILAEGEQLGFGLTAERKRELRVMIREGAKVRPKAKYYKYVIILAATQGR